jgi:ABC-2 type transport system permease protein
MKHLFIRILKQLKNDKRSIALIFIAPILVLTLLYLLLGDSDYKPIISLNNLPGPMTASLNKADATILPFPNNYNIDNYLKEKRADAVVSNINNSIQIRLLENDSVKSTLILNIVKGSLSSINPNANINVNFVYGKDTTNMFSSLAYVLLGFVSFFFVFLLAGISFIREKNYYTMERLLMTPIKRWEVIAGYTLGFGLVGAVQSCVILLFTKYILGIAFTGSIFYAILIMIAISLTAVAIGAFVSIFSNNEFQIMQFIPIIIIPQIFFAKVTVLLSPDTVLRGGGAVE